MNVTRNIFASILALVFLAGCGAVDSRLAPVRFWKRNTHGKSKVVMSVGKTKVWRDLDGRAFFFEGGMTIDADGSPRAYHPENKGLDDLRNAGRPRNWWGLVTDSRGNPYLQGPKDPAPGYYLSQTALYDATRGRRDPARYVNAETVPYIVLPKKMPEQKGGPKLGDLAAVVNLRNRRVAYAICADIGSAKHIGEGSMALAKSLGIDPNPRNGGADDSVLYVVFPGSGNGSPQRIDAINKRSESLFRQWGGQNRARFHRQ